MNPVTSEPEMLRKGTPASPATARASSVFPVPGGPTSSAPWGARADRRERPGRLRNPTISRSSYAAPWVAGHVGEGGVRAAVPTQIGAAALVGSHMPPDNHHQGEHQHHADRDVDVIHLPVRWIRGR